MKNMEADFGGALASGAGQAAVAILFLLRRGGKYMLTHMRGSGIMAYEVMG